MPLTRTAMTNLWSPNQKCAAANATKTHAWQHYNVCRLKTSLHIMRLSVISLNSVRVAAIVVIAPHINGVSAQTSLTGMALANPSAYIARVSMMSARAPLF